MRHPPSELAGIRYNPDDLRRSDIDLWEREITVHGKGRKNRTVKSATTPPAASTATCGCAPGTRSRTARNCGWANNRGPLTASGIYQMIARRGRQSGVDVYPHLFRHHFSHTWLDRGGPEGDLMELNGWTSPQMLRPLRRQRPQRPRPPHLRPHHDQHPVISVPIWPR